MSNFFAEYASFLAQTVTVLIACLILVITPMAMRSRTNREKGRIRVESMNESYTEMQDALSVEMMDDEERKSHKKAQKEGKKSESKQHNKDKNNVFVLDFEGDIKASKVDYLRKEITSVLGNAKPTDEVVVRLHSPGGTVDGYGLASSQLARIRQAGIPLTVSVDNVAASGGYMMACVANKIISAPFAVLGSIGVVCQIPNIHRLLKKHGVDYELVTAGDFKRTLTVVGENTEEGREKFKEQLAQIHKLFKNHVSGYRPSLDIDAISTGESWFGTDALERKLTDEIMISDDYLSNLSKTHNLYHIAYEPPKKGGLKKRLGMAASATVDAAFDRLIERLTMHRGF